MGTGRKRMALEQLLNDLFVDEPITITLTNGVEVKGTVHNRYRRNSEGPIGATAVIEESGNPVIVRDDDVERVVVEDAEWRRSGRRG